MSEVDRALLKRAKLSQTKIAALLGVSSQAVNSGVLGKATYFNAERLSKIVDLLEPEDPNKAQLLREELKRVVDDEAAGDDMHSPRFYLRRNSLGDVLERADGPLIWLPLDPLQRVTVESETLRQALLQRPGDLTVLVDVDADHVGELVRSRFALDYYQHWACGLNLVEQTNMTLHPELLVAMDGVWIRTAWGFQEATADDAGCMLKSLYRGSRLSPDHIPSKPSQGCRRILRVPAEPLARIGAELLRRFREEGNDDPETKCLVPPLETWLSTLATPPDTDRLFNYLLNALPEMMETDQGRKSSEAIRYALEQMHLESV